LRPCAYIFACALRGAGSKRRATGHIIADLAATLAEARHQVEAIASGNATARVPPRVVVEMAEPPPEIERQIIYVHQHSKWLEFDNVKTAPKWAHWRFQLPRREGDRDQSGGPHRL
jgi:hypothetical protein